MPSKIIKNTAWLTGSEAIGRLLRAALIIYAARVLGAANWGIFSYIVSLAALFTIISDVGLAAVLTRELIKFPQERHRYLATSLLIKIVLLIIIAAVIIFLSPYFTSIAIPRPLILATALLVIFDSLRSLGFAVTRAAEKMHLEAITNIVTQLLIVVLGFWALTQSTSIINLGWAYAAGSAFGFLLAAWFTRRWFRPLLGGFSYQLAKKIFSAAWPFALLGLLGAINLNVDIIMLGWLRTAEEIGLYSASQKIILVLYIIPALFATAAFPSLTRLANTNKEEFGRLLAQSIKTVLLIALPLTIGGLIIGDNLIVTLFGADYSASITAFKILLISLLINYPATIIGNALFAYDRQKEFVKYSGLGAASNIIFNFLLIPSLGIAGAALSTVATQLASNFFLWKIMRRANPFSLRGLLQKIVIANLLTGLIVGIFHFSGFSIFLTIPAAIICYFLFLYLLKEPVIFNLYSFLNKSSKL